MKDCPPRPSVADKFALVDAAKAQFKSGASLDAAIRAVESMSLPTIPPDAIAKAVRFAYECLERNPPNA